MQQALLRQRALELDEILRKHEAAIPEAVQLRSAIDDLLKQAESGGILQPIVTRPLPGERLFDQGPLQDKVDLANAFGSFAVKVSGGAPPALQEFRRRNGYDPLTGDKL